jgi:hypothetical protein
MVLLTLFEGGNYQPALPHLSFNPSLLWSII